MTAEKTKCKIKGCKNKVYAKGECRVHRYRAYRREYQKAYQKSARYKAYQREYMKAYRKTDKYKAYQKTDKYKAYQKAYKEARRHEIIQNYIKNISYLRKKNQKIKNSENNSKDFRKKCRKHNQLVIFGIDPEHKQGERGV